MSRNKSRESDFFESLKQMSHFGAVSEDDFQTATSELEERKRRITLEKQQREEAIKREKEEEEMNQLEDEMLRIELVEEEKKRLQQRSNKVFCSVGRGRPLSTNAPPFEPGGSFAPVPPSFLKSRRQAPPRTPPNREAYEDYDTVQPYLKQKPVSDVEKMIGGFMEKVNGPVNPYNNRNILNHFRPEEAEQRNKHSSDQHFLERYEMLYGTDSSSASSYKSSASPSPNPRPSTPPHNVQPSPLPPAPRNVRRKGTRMGANFFNALSDEEENKYEDKVPHITDICGSSARSLVPNGRKFASGPSINSLSPSQRIFNHALAQAVTNSGEFVYNKDEFPSLSG